MSAEYYLDVLDVHIDCLRIIISGENRLLYTLADPRGPPCDSIGRGASITTAYVSWHRVVLARKWQGSGLNVIAKDETQTSKTRH